MHLFASYAGFSFIQKDNHNFNWQEDCRSYQSQNEELIDSGPILRAFFYFRQN
jgi:hypothetical protein